MALAPYGLVLWNDAFPSKTNTMQLQWRITAAKTVAPLPLNMGGVLPFFDALANQAAIDNFLLTPSEFLAAQFDATAMGTDTFGCLIKMNGLKEAAAAGDNEVGQAASVQAMVASVYSGTNGATVVSSGVASVATLTSSSNTSQIAAGAAGDIALRIVAAGLDALTSGLIYVNIYWTAK